METHLKIIRLEASNIKKLKAVTITPQGNVVIISGSNDSGKTSTIDSIAYTLGGSDLICEVPIRTGASKAKSTVILGRDGKPEFKVTRSFSALGGSTLTIEDASGAPQRSPQTLLDKLCCHLAFDPLEFVRMKSDKQLEALRKLVGLDFTALDVARKKAYDERTLVNRDLAAAKARAAECEVEPETPDEEVSVTDLMAELTQIQEANRINAARRTQVYEAERSLNSGKDVLAEAIAEAAALEKRYKEKIAEVESFRNLVAEREKTLAMTQEAAAKLVDTDEAPLRQKISDAGSINAKVRDKKRFKQLQSEVEKTQKKTDALTEEIEAFDKEKSDQLAAAKFPLPGLSFDESGVLLNGVPFTQGSQARQLQAAVAIGIAMNPKVRVILIRDGSLLDEKSLALVSDMAAKNDCQIWIEIVSSDDPAAIVIEDGHVKEEE